MARHFQRELEKIKKSILSLGAKVEERVHQAATSIEEKDPDIAQLLCQNK